MEYKLYPTGVIQFETARSITRDAADFEQALMHWKDLPKNSDAPPLLAYILGSTPHAHPNLEILTGADDLKAKYLLERCTRQNMCAYFAQLQCTVHDSSIADIIELHSLVNLDGTRDPQASVEIELDQVIQEDVWALRDSNDSDCEPEDSSDEVEERHYKDMVRARCSDVIRNYSLPMKLSILLPFLGGSPLDSDPYTT